MWKLFEKSKPPQVKSSKHSYSDLSPNHISPTLTPNEEEKVSEENSNEQEGEEGNNTTTTNGNNNSEINEWDMVRFIPTWIVFIFCNILI